jgi:hypothetical protein
MTHPDPDYRKIAVMHRFWVRFVAGKFSLFVGAILILFAFPELQKRGLLNHAGTYTFIAADFAAWIGVLTWNFWPCKTCTQCGTRMRGAMFDRRTKRAG